MGLLKELDGRMSIDLSTTFYHERGKLQRHVNSIENAQIQPEEKSGTAKVLTIAGGHAVHDTYTAFLPALLPTFIANLSLNTTEAGFLTVLWQVPSILQPFIGHVADRISLRYLVIFAPAFTAIMMSLLGIANTFTALSVLLLLTGLSSAAMHAVGPVVAGNLSGGGLGRGMGFWMVGGELGRALGPIFVVTAIQLISLRGMPWLMILGIAVSIVLLILLRDVPGRASNAGKSLPWRDALRGMRKLILPLAGILAARAFMIAALTTFMPTFLTREGSGFWVAGASLSLLEIAGVLGAFLGGVISDRIGRHRMLFVSMLATSISMFLFLMSSGWMRVLLLPVLGFTALSVAPVIMALVQESYPENRALANGIYMAMNFLIRSVMVMILGVIGDLLGLRIGYFIGGVIMLLGLPLVYQLPKRDQHAVV
jgi:FSR family fosmidomycin resistance protein-like MFS transporter